MQTIVGFGERSMNMIQPRLVRSVSLIKRFTSPKKVLGLVGVGLSMLTFARATCLLVESYSAVFAERHADFDLIRLCDEGSALQSADFRSLCLKKRAERAAPVVLKAVTRAVVVAFTEFCEVFSSPSRVILLVLFSLTGMAAPVLKVLCKLFMQNLKTRNLRRSSAKYATSDSESESDDEQGKHYQIVDMSERPAYGTRQRMQLQFRRSLRHVTGGGVCTPALLEEY